MQQPGSPYNWLRQLPLLCIIQSCAHPSLTNPVMICDAQVLDTCSFGNKWTARATLPFDETRWSVGRMDYDGSSMFFPTFSDLFRPPRVARWFFSALRQPRGWEIWGCTAWIRAFFTRGQAWNVWDDCLGLLIWQWVLGKDSSWTVEGMFTCGQKPPDFSSNSGLVMLQANLTPFVWITALSLQRLHRLRHCAWSQVKTIPWGIERSCRVIASEWWGDPWVLIQRGLLIIKESYWKKSSNLWWGYQPCAIFP